MRISDELLDSFIALYKEKHGETLDRDTAYDKATRLLRLVEIVESNAEKMN
jgi:hypothetical protein